MNSQERVYVSEDKSKLDLDIIHDYLSHRSYWAKGRSLQEVERSINNSFCFGLYLNNDQMIGFARVLSDEVVFAYLMDVFILEEYRGRGYSKVLLQGIVNHSCFKVQYKLLGTRDAHDLYKPYGFKALENPERWMLNVDLK